MMPGFFTNQICELFALKLRPLMIPDVFWHRCSSVCSRIGQRHRVQQVDVTRIGLAQNRSLFSCVRRPTHQISPHLIVRRLAGARYQLDSPYVQAEIVDNGRPQEDPVIRLPGHGCRILDK